MSQIVSPKTGRLVKVGGKAYNDLLKDPMYRDSVLNPESLTSHKGKVSPARSPRSTLPPLSSTSPTSLKSLPPLPALSPRSPRSPLSSRLPPLNGVYSPPSPSPSLKNLVPMPVLPSPRSQMKFAKIPSLEETLKHTRQPARREKLERMIEEGKAEEGRGIRTRGWGARSPTRGRERHQLKQECGNKCFLLPEEEKFPICASPRMSGGKSSCEVDCGGVQAALVRARQWGYEDVAKKAEQLLERCEKEGIEHFVPSAVSPRSGRLPSPRIQPSLRMGGNMPEDYGVVRRNVRRSVLLNHDHWGHGDHHDHHDHGDHHRRPDKHEQKGCGCGK